jgi:rubrerythrin
MEKTIKNLAAAFVGESQARNRYTTYGKIAKKEGFEKIAATFALTADQEAEHAKWLMRMINNLKRGNTEYDTISIDAGVPTVLGKTAENLAAAIKGESYEHNSMYPEFANTAEEENLPEVAIRLRAIAKAEENHESIYKELLEDLESGKTFKKDKEVVWVCRKCGHIHTSEEAPDECPSCGHPQAYFEVKK